MKSWTFLPLNTGAALELGSGIVFENGVDTVLMFRVALRVPVSKGDQPPVVDDDDPDILSPKACLFAVKKRRKVLQSLRASR